MSVRQRLGLPAGGWRAGVLLAPVAFYVVPGLALLLAVFPANLNMAMNAAHYPGIEPLALYLRLPLQGVLAAWAYWATRPAHIATATREGSSA